MISVIAQPTTRRIRSYTFAPLLLSSCDFASCDVVFSTIAAITGLCIVSKEVLQVLDITCRAPLSIPLCLAAHSRIFASLSHCSLHNYAISCNNTCSYQSALTEPLMWFRISVHVSVSSFRISLTESIYRIIYLYLSIYSIIYYIYLFIVANFCLRPCAKFRIRFAYALPRSYFITFLHVTRACQLKYEQRLLNFISGLCLSSISMISCESGTLREYMISRETHLWLVREN